MVGKDLECVWILGTEWKLEALILGLLLLTLELVKELDILFRVYHAAAVLWVDGQVLVINNETAVEFSLTEQTFSPVARLLEILEVFLIMLHNSLLFLVFRCDDTFMSFFEELLLRVYPIEDHFNVTVLTLQ